MKKALLILAAAALSASVFAQGKITFGNIDLPNATGGGTYSPGIWAPGHTGSLNANSLTGSTGGAGAGYTAGLFLQGSTVALISAPMYTTANGAGFEWAIDTSALSSADASVTGIAPGNPASLQVKVYQTGKTWETTPVGSRSLITDGLFTSKNLGGPDPGGGPAFFTPAMTGFAGLVVPEPTTYALGVLGLGALAMMRRRKA